MKSTFAPQAPLPRGEGDERKHFRRAPFGPFERFVWPRGAIEIGKEWTACWGSFAVIADPTGLRVVAATLDARAILIDLLGDAGEACAETFALLALGPLAYFLDELEFRGRERSRSRHQGINSRT